MSFEFDTIVPRLNTDSMKWDMLEERFGDKDLLPLWVADMDFKAPNEVIAALRDKVDHGVYGYPKAAASVYQALTKWMKQRHSWSVEADMLHFTIGVVPALSTAIQAFTEKQDAIMIQTPVYYPFFSVINTNDRKLVTNELLYDGNYYTIDFTDFENKIKENNVKMFILCNPHNPVGRVWTEAELQKMGDICLEHDVLIVSDEIHSDLILAGHKHIPIASISADLAQNTMTCMAPSKTFNLAGLQASAMIFTNESHKEVFKTEQARQAISVNSFGLTAMEAAYTYGEPWLEQLLSYIEKNIEFLQTFIETHLPKLKVIKPEGTYLVWVDCNELNLSNKELEQLFLKKAKVALNQGFIFGKGGEGFVRINVACPQTTLEAGLNKIKGSLEDLM